MKRARFVGPARLELLAEVAYYGKAQYGLGERFAAAVEEATIRALAFPEAGSPFAAGARRMFVKGFPFSIVYKPEESGIVIFAVTHHARRPGYWRSRIQDR